MRRESFLLIGRSFDPFLYTFCKMCRVSVQWECKYCNFHHTHNLSHLNIITNGHYAINTFNTFRLTGGFQETQTIEQYQTMVLEVLEVVVASVGGWWCGHWLVLSGLTQLRTTSQPPKPVHSQPSVRGSCALCSELRYPMMVTHSDTQ